MRCALQWAGPAQNLQAEARACVLPGPVLRQGVLQALDLCCAGPHPSSRVTLLIQSVTAAVSPPPPSVLASGAVDAAQLAYRSRAGLGRIRLRVIELAAKLQMAR